MDRELSFDTTLNILSQNEDFKSNLLNYTKYVYEVILFLMFTCGEDGTRVHLTL